MNFLFSFTKYDIFFCAIIAIAILYGMARGLLAMLKPIIAVIVARFLSSYIRGLLSSQEIADVLSNIASEKTGISSDYQIMQMGSTLVSETIISVLSFVISYIIIRVVLTILFSALRIRRRGILFKCDRLAGGLLSFAVICLFIYYVGIGSTALAHIGFTSAAELSDGIANSFVPSRIVSLTGTVLNDIRLV